ncbi:MAG TPA: 16S rRNA (guanine(527)-N(7))-methyltransferase RsmG [Burkholderiales bacterium]|nr:16S rRNA (guanine(527)-N(7))-methyltransferase RsmG [Burkholderiales bacterium]
MNAATLRDGLLALGLPLEAAAQHKLLAYLALVQKWNKVYNLTAIHDETKLVSHHLLDCLAVVRWLSGDTVLDVGSGAGLPGIPIAIACADKIVTLLDSSHKKTAFLQQVKTELDLQNVQVETARVEAYRPTQGYDVVISRAFAELAEFYRAARALCAPGGRLIAMKGVYPDEEIAQMPSGAVEKIVPLVVPALSAQRHLIFLDPAGKAS